MSFLRTSSTVDSESLAVASLTIPIPSPHQTDDLIILSITQDGGGTNITTAASGWTLIGTQGAVQGQRTVNYWKIATSSSEPDVTFTGFNSTWFVTATVWGGANTTTPINGFASTNMTGNANSVTATAVTTTANNCTVLYVNGFDGINLQTVAPSSLVHISAVRGTSGASQFTGYTNQPTAGATPTPTFLVALGNEAGQLWTIAINDATPSTPKMSPYTNQVMDVIAYIGSSFNIHDTVTLGAPSDLTPTTIDSLPLSSVVPVTLGISLTSSPYGNFTRVRSTENTLGTPLLAGLTYTLAAPVDMSDGFLTLEFGININTSVRSLAPNLLLVIEDGVGAWKAYNISNSRNIATAVSYQFVFDLENFTAVDSGGTIDLTDIEKVAILDPRTAASGVTTIQEFYIKNLFLAKKVKIIGGSEESPANLTLLKNFVDGWNGGFISSVQGKGQVLSRVPYQIGDAGVATYSSTFSQSSELPLPFNSSNIAGRVWSVGDSSVVNSVYAGSAGVVGLNSTIFATSTRQKFLIDPTSSSAADWNFAGSSFIGYDIENKAAGVIFNQCTFAECYQVVLEGSGLSGVLVDGSLSSTAVITDSPNLISDSTFISTGTGHAIEMTDIGTFDFEGNTFTGYGADGTSNAAIYNNSGGLITLDLAPGDIAPTVLNGTGASTTINAFVASVGLDFTGLIAGSQVVIYDTGTTTEIFRENSSGTSESYDEVTTSLDVDYTIMKAGYVPIRVTGLHLTSVQSVPVQQVEDRAYVASSGLTFNTNAFANPGTKIFDLTTASTVQNFYSFMIESWIAQTTLRNVQFPIEPNGPNSFTFTGGWEFADQDAIDLLSRDGMRYRNAGVITAVWSAILSLGTATGFQGRYQQELGEASTDAPATGVFDQLIQVFGDATHGNFDYTDYLVLKFQPNGYRQVSSDIFGLYGTLADEFYITAMEPVEIPDFTTGDPSITGVSITNHGASPVSWDAGNGAKNYSITITDSATNSAEDILRWINYNLSLGGTFQSDEAFNWPDMVVYNGSTYETERGTVIGSAGASLKGIRVIRTGDTPHPNFARFQADDGTYGLPPVTVGITFTGLIAGSQVVVYDTGTTTEYFRDNTSGTSESFTEVATSIDVDYTIQKAGYVPIRVTGLELTSIQTVPIQQVEDRAYVASTGLTFGTTATVNTGTLIFDLTVASTVQNYYSFMIESWIAESALKNVAFPIEPNGPNSFTFGGGWEFADQDAIDLLSRDGMRYRDSGTVTAIWLSILSIGSATGLQGRYQQVIGAAATDAPTTGAFDQLIQVFGDATHGNFDYSGYLVLKYQANGFFEAISDVEAIYGTLADEAYVTALEPVAIPSFTTGDPMITGVTITNHGASPVSWNAGNGAKDYSITIADSGTNTGEDILRWVNYNLSLGGTFQGDQAFNWFDMITTDGVTIETFRGTVINSAGAALKGVRVIRTGDVAHPDFARFQADDGTYGLAPEVQKVTVTNGVAGSRLQIYDLTSSTELYNDIPGSYPYTWQDSAAYVADREIRVRAMYQSGATAKIFIDSVIGTATSTEPALSVRLNQVDDTVYNTNAIDGSAVTDITIDDGALLVEIDTGSVSWPQIYAYETYWLFTEEGIRDEGRFIEAKDTANYILYDFKIKNVTSPEVPLTITNGWGYDSVTGTTIELFDTSGGAIFAAPDRVVAFATGSGLSPEEQAQLALVELIKPNTDLIPALL